MNYQGLVICVLVPMALAAAPASATWLSSADLEQHCDAYLEDAEDESATACVAFVQGFLAGTEATRKAAGISPSAGEEDFEERAARTRVGSRLRWMYEQRSAAYCIADEVPPAAVIEIVISHLAEQPWSDDMPAERVVRRALAENFPCDEQ